jgi:hypothetical protein
MKVNQIVSEIKKGSKDSNGFTKCWPSKHAEGTKKGKNGGQVRNCVPNESVSEAANAAQQAAIAIAKKKKKAMSETTVEIAPTQPTPGQDTVKINGQAVANTDAATATAIKTAAEKGQFTPVTDQPTTEGLFGTSEEELAKDPSPAGEYYRKLAALKTDPRWAAKQDIVQKRIQDLINRLNLDKGIPQPDQGQPAGPETDPAKFQQKNPNFKEGHKDTIAQGGGKIGGDPTDRYIAQIRDKKFTNAQRNTTGQRSPLGENDELYKWLTIAGIK